MDVYRLELSAWETSRRHQIKASVPWILGREIDDGGGQGWPNEEDRFPAVMSHESRVGMNFGTDEARPF